jgi:hypothetical protein
MKTTSCIEEIMNIRNVEGLQDDADKVLDAYGFFSFSIDFSDVEKSDAIALIDFMRMRKFGITQPGISTCEKK